MEKLLDETHFLNIYKDEETLRLEARVYLDGSSYSELALATLKKILNERTDRIIEFTHKFCPTCKKIVGINEKICACGYCFIAPNINEIKAVDTKRKSKNRIFGLFMIIAGSIILAIYWPSDKNLKSNEKYNMYIYGIPTVMILIGIGTLLSGSISKKPTGTLFDTVLGAPKSFKELDEQKQFFLCKSCGKPIFEELGYEKCPSCGNIIIKE